MIKIANCSNFNWHISLAVKFLAQFCHCHSFRKRSWLMLSSELSFRFSFTSIVNEFEVCFCKVQTEYFSPRFCDQFKGKLAVFSLAKGVGRNSEGRKEVRFLPIRPRKPCFKKLLYLRVFKYNLKEKQWHLQKTIDLFSLYVLFSQ